MTGEIICDICGKLFKTNTHLKTHKTIHSEFRERIFNCNECSKSFYNIRVLQGHKSKTHAKELNNVCEKCPMKFATAYQLKSHQRSHTSDKPYIC